MAIDTNQEACLIFDFGGVVSRTLFETHDLTEQALGLPAGTLAWRGPFDPSSDPLWTSMQNDEITERDYWSQRTREVGLLVGKDWTQMSDFVKAARGANPSAVIRPEFIQTIRIARQQGVRLSILSNELDLFYGAGFRDKLPFLKDFEIIHDATYTGILKPDPKAYLNLLKELNVQAQSCVFIDDQYRNVKGALAVGLPTVHFDVSKPADSYREALALLGISSKHEAKPDLSTT